MVIHVDAVTSAEDVAGSDLHERTVALTPLTVQYACFSMNVKTQKINITKEKITLFFLWRFTWKEIWSPSLQ